MNLIPILEKLPKDYKLWSPICGYCSILKISEFKNDTNPIIVISDNNYVLRFTKEGKSFDEKDAKCLLFPSKEERDWKKFNDKVFSPFKIERIKGEKYYYLESFFINEEVEYFTLTDDINYKYNNYFNTREQAEIAVASIKQYLKSLRQH